MPVNPDVEIDQDETRHGRRRAACRGAILSAARQIFSAEGYDGASMDRIAEAAGVTKRTVYGHFPSKDALFARVIDRSSQAVLEHLPSIADLPIDPQKGLALYLTRLRAMFETPNCAGVKRIVVAEAERHPEFVAKLYPIYLEIEARIGAYLETCVAAGALRPHDCAAAARLFCDAAVQAESFRTMLALPPRNPADVIAVFVAAYAPA